MYSDKCKQDASPKWTVLFCCKKAGGDQMNTVQPIRDMDLVMDVADYLKNKNERDYVMYMFGIYTGLRISDILKLRVRDVKWQDYIYMREKKTGKEKRIKINDTLKKIINHYVSNKKDYEYLIKSKKSPNKPISRQQAYNILSEAAQAFGIKNIGTHTLRKTWGYHAYQQTHDVVTIQEILNHSDPSVTLRYIGINQDNKDDIMGKLHFGRNKR